MVITFDQSLRSSQSAVRFRAQVRGNLSLKQLRPSDFARKLSQAEKLYTGSLNAESGNYRQELKLAREALRGLNLRPEYFYNRVPLDQAYEQYPEYRQFVEDLELSSSLRFLAPNTLNISRAAGIDPSAIYTPSLATIKLGYDYPEFGIRLFPSTGETKFHSFDSLHFAPIVVQNVSTWGQEQDSLGKLAINKLGGVPEDKQILEKNLSLKDIVNYLNRSDGENIFSKFSLDPKGYQINSQTKVIELVCFMPDSSAAPYNLAFNPFIRTNDNEHSLYRACYISEETFVPIKQLIDRERKSRHVNAIFGRDGNMVNQGFFEAKSIQQISAVEKLSLAEADSMGHMIFFLSPSQEEHPWLPSLSSLQQDYGYSGGAMKGVSFGGGAYQYGANINRAKIGQGPKTGDGELKPDELYHSPKGKNLIVHVKFVTVSRQEISERHRSGNLLPIQTLVNNYPKV